MTAKARGYEATAGLALVFARGRLKWQRVRWCRVRLAFWNVPHDGDVDGFMKGVLHCLQRAAVFEKHRYVVEAVVSKRWDDGAVRTDVEVETVGSVPGACPAGLSAEAPKSPLGALAGPLEGERADR